MATEGCSTVAVPPLPPVRLCIFKKSAGTQNGPKLRALFVWYEHLLMFRFPCHLYMMTREFRAILDSSTFLKNK